MEYNELLYLSGKDIPFIEGGLIIHQPTLEEIAFLGEETFFTGCEFLKFDKNILAEEDKIHLENQSNFEVFIAIMKENNITIQKQKICVLMVLSLLFPKYLIDIKEDYISLKEEGKEEEFKINNSNFEAFKMIIIHMFCLDGEGKNKEYNPSGEMARKISEKLKKRHQKIAESKGEKSINILNKYISILAVGANKDLNNILKYTIYQLFEEFKRLQLKMQWDIVIQARMAGATNVEDPEDWMKDLH